MDKLDYTITIIGPGWTKCRTCLGAPSDVQMSGFALCHGASMATRYFPSRKGWLLYDLRTARTTAGGGTGNWRKLVGHTRLKRTYPTEEAAVMHAMTILSREAAIT